MKITFCSSSLDPGGAERVLSELANYWSKKGHTVSIMTLSSPEDKSFYTLDGNIKTIPLNQKGSSSFGLRRIVKMVQRIISVRKSLMTSKPDVIVSFVDVMNMTTLLASLGLKIPVIVSERTTPWDYHLNKLQSFLRRLTYPWAKKLVVQTQHTADYFPYLKNISIIPNAAPAVKEKKTPSFECKKLISVGRLCPFKGFDTLIRSFRQLLNQYPDLTLSLYGEGSDRVRLEALISSLELQNYVFLPGTTKNIQEALCQSDLFVFPSLYEGFPNALCEAMAVGLPVIASNCSGNIDIVRDKVDGRLFPIGDVEALTKLMSELLDDHEQRLRLATAAQDVSQRFHRDKIYAKWDCILENVFQERYVDFK